MWVLLFPFLLFVGTSFMFFAGLPVLLAGLFNFFETGRLRALEPLAEASMCSKVNGCKLYSIESENGTTLQISVIISNSEGLPFTLLRCETTPF